MEYIAVDVETTGLNPFTDHIIEIGAARFIDGIETEHFISFIQPGSPVPERITELTGITDDMLEDAPGEESVMRAFLEFAGESTLLGHNLPFDYGFLKSAAERSRLVFEREGIDTLRIAKRFLSELESRSLESLCRHFQIDNGTAHRAYDDAKSAAALFQILTDRFAEAEPKSFAALPMQFKVKKTETMTAAQKNYLNDLIKYHKIKCDTPFESMTKSEASRRIDQIILEYGRIPPGSRVSNRRK